VLRTAKYWAISDIAKSVHNLTKYVIIKMIVQWKRLFEDLEEIM
jgi:hypothetical protein